MAGVRTSRLVIATLAAVALALTIVASWRGSGRNPDGSARPAGELITGGHNSTPSAEEAPGRDRPEDETIAPASECPDMPSDSYADITAEWIARQVEIGLAERGNVIGRLALSDDPDHRLAAVLMSHSDKRRPGDQVEAISGILVRHPDHTLAFWNLVVMCGRALQHDSCSDAALSAGAERIDKENSEVWALLAVYRDRRDDTRGALAAMQRAIGSASTSVYYAEQILVFERAYAAASDYGPSQRLVHAVGDVAALPLQHTQVFNACRRLAKRDFVWRRMCFDYGQIMESRARSLMTEQFGLALQLKIATLDGDKDMADEVQQRLQSAREIVQNDDMGTIFDDQVNTRYLEELSVHGERAALAFLGDEIERRRALVEGCL